MDNNTITVGEVRLSYCNLFQAKPPFNAPQGDLKFSTTILLPKTNTAAKAAIDQAIAAAFEAGVSAKWNGVRPPQPSICVHDGDGPRPSDGQPFGEECKGCWVFTASCKADRPPFVVDTNVQPIIQQSDIYSGCYGNVNVSFFAYANSGKKGIGCGLNGFQKIRDGEPLASSVSATEAFGAVSAAAPATPGYAVPGYTAAAPAYPTPAAVPAYPTPAQQAYPASPSAAGWGVDPITGQPLPNGTQILGM